MLQEEWNYIVHFTASRAVEVLLVHLNWLMIHVIQYRKVVVWEHPQL